MECVKCGSPSGESILCLACFMDGREMVVAPEQVAVLRCGRCGRFSDRGTRWFEGPDEAVWAVLRDQVSAPEDLADVGISLETTVREQWSTATVRVVGNYGREHVSAEREVAVKVRSHACQDCSRRAGTYFEAIVQVRGGPPRPGSGNRRRPRRAVGARRRGCDQQGRADPRRR